MSHVATDPEIITTAAPAQRTRPRLVLTLACSVMAMVGIDTAIVNVALPSIQRDLGAGPSVLQWVVVAYGLLLGGFLLLGGRMSDQLGRRRIFLIGLAVFTAASFLAGSATEVGLLITARAVQGFGAALTVPAGLSLLAVTFAEGSNRDRALGIFGAVGGMAGGVGVVASGLLTGGPGWRWGFFINVPIGVVLIALAAVFLAPDRVRRTTRLDITGAITVTGGLLLFVYALHHGANHDWISGPTMALFAAAGVLLAAFARIEARSAAPIVPPSTWKNRKLVAANLTGFLSSCAFFSFIFIASLLMQQMLGYSPIKTGLAWLATTVTIFPVAMAGGQIAALVGVRRLLISGLSLFTVGMLWLIRVPADATYLTDVLPAFLLAGIGFGLCMPALQIGALSGVAREDAGLASGLIETSREVGGAAGVAAVSTVLVAGTGLASFHIAFVIIVILAVLGLITAVFGFARRA
ncbi:MAG TPA: MFS transporter [Jiangellaceae bacterium]